MARLLHQLDLPDDWRDYPDRAKHDWFENNTRLTELTAAVVDEYDLPESDREDFPYLNKEQWIALVRELDGENE